MDAEMQADLLHHAERRYHLKVFENISEGALHALPLVERLRVVGRAVMQRTDHDGLLIGRKLLAQAERLEAA